MISKIIKINYLRNFINFSSVEEFKKINVIYAVNGMGKTNISRFFDCISNKTLLLENLKSKEAEASQIEFELAMNNTVIDEENYKSLNLLDQVFVYNSDYIEDNIRTTDFSDKEIDGKLEIELGEEQKKLSDLEQQKEAKIFKLANLKVKLEEDLQATINDIKAVDPRNKKTIEALTYDSLTEQTYAKNLSEKKEHLDELGKSCEGWIDAEQNFNDIKDLDVAKDKISFIAKEIDLDRVDFSWIEAQLKKKVLFPEPPIGIIKDHIEKLSNEWIETGLLYHKKDKNNCPFCRLALDEEARIIIRQYKEYIASEKTKFENFLDNQIKNIDIFYQEIENLNNNQKIEFYLRIKNLNLKINWIELNTKPLLTFIKILKENLLEKKASPSQIFFEKEASQDKNLIVKIKDEVTIINKSIISNKNGVDLINKKLSTIGVRQTELRNLLAKKHRVLFYEKNQKIIDERDEINREIKGLESHIDVIKKDLPSIDVSEKIVYLFNLFIHKIGINKYSAEMDGNRLMLKLENLHNISSEANKLVSEGEKNAIALSYFFASSIRKLNNSDKFSNAIFIIDDPICSMSYQYFYGVCNVIKTFSKDIHRVLQSNNDKLPQRVILTHNVQFYNMLINNVFKNKAEYFELEKTKDGHTLRKLKSEEKFCNYKTALRRVKGYADGKIFENVGNDLRKVLEILCHFHGYKLEPEGVKAIFPDIKDSLLMMANDGSHLNINDYEDPFDSTQYREMTKDLINLMQGRFSNVIKSISE